MTTGTPESRVVIGYDSLWNAYVCETKREVTSVNNVTTTIREFNEYDKLGKLLTSKTQELMGYQVLYESQYSYEYDLLGRVTKVTNPPHDSSNTTSYKTVSYNDVTRQTTTTNELGNMYGQSEPATITRQTYDGLGRAIYSEWKDEQGNWHLSSYVKYDSLGRTISAFDAASNETKYEYDAFGRVIKTIYADDNPYDRSMSERWYVDTYVLSSIDPTISLVAPSGFDTLALGGFSIHKDAEGNYSYSAYDILGRSVWVATNKKGYSSSAPTWDMIWYEYDKLNRVTKVAINRTATDWDITEYEYSYNGHNTVSSSPLTMKLPGNVESKYVYEYNARGLVIKEYQVNTSSKVTTMEYDQIGRLIKITYPTEHEYVNVSDTGFVPTTQNVTRKLEYYYNIYGMTKANSFKNNVLENSVLMEYNKRGWLMSETWIVNPQTNETYSFAFTYDASGNKLSMQYPDQSVVSYHYDELHRLKSIPGFFENNGGSGFIYDNVGNLTDMYAVNGIHTEYAYNQRNMVTSISSDSLSLSYVYDHTRNITSITDSSSGTAVTLNYTYDARGQLLTADVRRDDGIYTVSYSYDGANNRVSEVWTDGQNYIVSQTSFSYQSGSYLNSKYGTTGTAYYTWNTVGQLSTKTDNGSTQTHLFGGMGHLSGVSKDGTILEVYTYDALGRRLKVATSEEIALNFPLGNDSGYEVKKDLSTGHITTTKYISVNGKYLAKTVQENGGTEQKYFHHVDMVGSIRAITDMSGQVTASYEYEPFGLVVISDGEDDDNLGFAGKKLDGTGLSYFGGRYYDAEIGRFISRDPVRSGRNWFVYCSNNPLIYIDPTGYMDSLEGWLENPLGYVTDEETGERINNLDPSASEDEYWDDVNSEPLVDYILKELNSKNPNLFSSDDEAAFYFGKMYSILSHNFGIEIGAHGYYTSSGVFYLSGAYTSFLSNKVNHPLDINGFDSFGNKAEVWFHTHTLGEGEVFSQGDILEQVRGDLTGYVVTPGGKLIKHSNKTHDINILSESMPMHPKYVYDQNEYQNQLDYQKKWLDFYNRLYGLE